MPPKTKDRKKWDTAIKNWEVFMAKYADSEVHGPQGQIFLYNTQNEGHLVGKISNFRWK